LKKKDVILKNWFQVFKKFYPDLKRYYSKEKDFNVNYELQDSFALERFADIKNMEPFYLAEGIIFNKFE